MAVYLTEKMDQTARRETKEVVAKTVPPKRPGETLCELHGAMYSQRGAVLSKRSSWLP